jgi:hypothetical protein
VQLTVEPGELLQRHARPTPCEERAPGREACANDARRIDVALALEPQKHVGHEAREEPAQLRFDADDVEVPAAASLFFELAEEQLDAPTLAVGLERPMSVGLERHEQTRPVAGDPEEQRASGDALRQVHDLELPFGRWAAEGCPPTFDLGTEILERASHSCSSSRASRSSVSR